MKLICSWNQRFSHIGHVLPWFSGVISEAGYEEDTGIDLSVSAYVGTKQGRKPIEGLAGKPGPRRQEVFEEESVQQMLQYLRQLTFSFCSPLREYGACMPACPLQAH